MKYLLIIALFGFCTHANAQKDKPILNQRNAKIYMEALNNQSKYIDTLITIRLTKSKFKYLKQHNVNFSAEASEFLANYVVAQPDTSKTHVVEQRILDDGSFETTYDDGSKRIDYKGGYTIITPDGKRMKASFVQVPAFMPPENPADPEVSQYLENVSDGLLSFLSELLNNDEESISNFKKGDAGLNLYQIINRRFEFINYIMNQK